MAIDIGSTNNGVYQWLFQRKTNFLIVVYGLVMASHFLSDAATDYDATVAFFSKGWVIFFSALVLILICLNSVLAGWQIAGDYVGKIAGKDADKEALINKLFMGACIIITIGYLIFGFILLL